MTPPVHRAWRLATLSLASLSMSVEAGAQETGRFRFVWARDDGAERCPDGPTLARDVARRLGRDPFVTIGGAPSIDAIVRREGSTWVARIVVRDAGGGLVGTRDFTSASPDCTAIAAAVTLGVALSIDPEAALRPPPAEPAPAPLPPPPAPVVTPARPAPAAPWWRRAGASARVRLLGGVVPGPGVGGAVGAEWGPLPWLRIGGGASFFPESETTSPNGTFAFGLTTSWFSACAEPWRGAVAAMGFCLGAEAGALHAVVRRGVPSQAGESAWGAVTGAARLRLHVAGPFTAELGLEAVVPFARHRFVVANAPGGNAVDTVFQQGVDGSPVVLGGFAGLGLQFR